MSSSRLENEAECGPSFKVRAEAEACGTTTGIESTDQRLIDEANTIQDLVTEPDCSELAQSQQQAEDHLNSSAQSIITGSCPSIQDSRQQCSAQMLMD